MSNTIFSVLKNAESNWENRDFLFSPSNNDFAAKTFGQLSTDTAAVSKALLTRGFGGKHALIVSENTYQWMILDLALAGFVGVSASVHFQLPSASIASAIIKGDIAFVFYSTACAPSIELLKTEFSMPFYEIETEFPLLLKEGNGILLDDLEPIPENSFSKIVFSSGTLGAPKAIMLTQKNLFAGFEPLYRRTPLSEADRVYLVLPLNHTYAGVYNFLGSLYFGMELYLSSGLANMAEDFAMIKPTVFCAVPKILARFIQFANSTPDPNAALEQVFGESLKYLFCGGSKCPESVFAAFEKTNINLLNAYALSETASSLSIDYLNARVTGAVGVVFENLQVKIDQPDGHGMGELLVKGDPVFLGYYGDSTTTKEAFTEDGFFKTGDIGSIDEKGYIYLVGRKDRIFTTAGGEIVNPESLEQLLVFVSDVFAARVYQKDGHLCAILIPPEETASFDPDSIIKKVNLQVPKYMKITEWSVGNPNDISGWKDKI